MTKTDQNNNLAESNSAHGSQTLPRSVFCTIWIKNTPSIRVGNWLTHLIRINCVLHDPSGSNVKKSDPSLKTDSDAPLDPDPRVMYNPLRIELQYPDPSLQSGFKCPHSIRIRDYQGTSQRGGRHIRPGLPWCVRAAAPRGVAASEVKRHAARRLVVQTTVTPQATALY